MQKLYETPSYLHNTSQILLKNVRLHFRARDHVSTSVLFFENFGYQRFRLEQVRLGAQEFCAGMKDEIMHWSAIHGPCGIPESSTYAGALWLYLVGSEVFCCSYSWPPLLLVFLQAQPQPQPPPPPLLLLPLRCA